MDIRKRIEQLKRDKGAIIIAHNYQSPEVQDVADILGDSLDLAKKAACVEQKTVVFCGVDFMADTAKIIAPEKTILVPNRQATCPMANMINPEQLKALKKQYPLAKVVTYVNSTVQVKALTDVCCTSANAVKIVNSIDADQIIFIPDRNLGSYCQRFTNKQLILWNGYCYIHNKFNYEEVKVAKEKMPQASLFVHPECSPEIIDLADEVLSTSAMIQKAKESKNTQFLIATEEAMIYRLRKEIPDKEFFSAGKPKTCIDMKKNTLQDIVNVLENEDNQIEIDLAIADKARKALTAMLSYS